VLGRQNQALLLGGGDAGTSTAEPGIAAQAHFDEDQSVAVGADQVDLAALDPVVAGQYPQALACQPGSGQIFRRRAAGWGLRLAQSGSGPENAGDERHH